jgi:hypothetical protein
MIAKYVKLVVNNFNKWFLDLSIFNSLKLFNPKHDLDNVPQLFFIFFIFYNFNCNIVIIQ